MDFSAFFNYPEQDEPTEQPPDTYIFLPQWKDHDWSKLLHHTQTHVFQPGEVVLQSGDTGRALYLVGAGTLEVLLPKAGGDGFLRIVTIETGSVIGEQSFLDGKARSATIRAVDDCQLYLLSLEAFEIFAAHEPQLARSLIFDLGRIISLRLRETMRQMPTWR